MGIREHISHYICIHLPVISYKHTLLSAPGLVTNLTAFAQNHSFVVVTWFLPRRINGLITKFAVKAKHARTGQTVRTLEVNAEDIMTVALPHCNVHCTQLSAHLHTIVLGVFIWLIFYVLSRTLLIFCPKQLSALWRLQHHLHP